MVAYFQMFHIVVFDNTNEVEVVPSVWIENGECMWPPNKINVAKAVKSQECPGDGWMPHKARIIFTSHDYNEARLKLPQAVDHTDLGSDGGDLPIKFKRKRIRKNILFPGEDDEEMESTLKVTLPNAPKIPRQYKTPTLKPGKQGQNLQPSGNSSPDFPPSGNSSPDFPPSGNSSPEPSPSQHSCTSKFPSSCHTNTENRTPRRASTESRRMPRHTERSILPSRHPEAHQTREQTSSLQTSLLRSILTKQEMMMDQLRIIFKTLQGMKATDEAEIGLDRNLLPVKDVSSLQNLEEQLQSIPDLQKQLVNTLALKGGTDICECVWRIMHAMITNSLAKNINMRGINGKIGFQRLQIRDVVIVQGLKKEGRKAGMDKMRKCEGK
ncbi:uncharacterized protein LOC123964074 [Micropterus dolomieu]|uniref:uncharacterized protein LOC123964074 n=1 Tax=Micropterus dolomieu TaxID=147949 RepID=UPI001E8D2B87|nr:uncharacterized protein LOC123964074 [Micropterus dolomieu]